MGRLGRLPLRTQARRDKEKKESSVPHNLRHERSLLLSILSRSFQHKPIAAAIGYLDDLLLHKTPLSAREVKSQLLEGAPLLAQVLKTSWGSIATVILPRFQHEMYTDEVGLLNDLVNAFKLCKRLGVQSVSLTGLIPSATGYGEKLRERLAQHPGLPVPTTGHATTTACMVLSTLRVLEEAGRKDRMKEESVVFVGLGSIGVATLRLFLRVLPHPRKISLCDVMARQSHLESVAEECRSLGYAGPIQILLAEGTTAPIEVYDNTLFMGATNAANVLDVDLLRPGTCVVDDSAPHCFDAEKAKKRVQQKADILVTEGGPLKTGDVVFEHFFLPKRWEMLAPKQEEATLTRVESSDSIFEIGSSRRPCEIMGCTFSSLLTALEPKALPSTIGPVQLEDSERHFQYLQQQNFTGCDLSLDGDFFDRLVPVRFRQLAMATNSWALSPSSPVTL